METAQLRGELISALADLYGLKAFSTLLEFVQGELRVLYCVAQNPDRAVTPSLLSDSLGLSRPRITAALAALRRKGFLAMEVLEADRRRMLVTLTPVGAAFLREKQADVMQYFDRLVKGLGAENVHGLSRLIALCVAVMDGDGTRNPEPPLRTELL